MRQLIIKDTEDTVVNSLGIISFVSFFIGGVITIQMALSNGVRILAIFAIVIYSEYVRKNETQRN